MTSDPENTTTGDMITGTPQTHPSDPEAQVSWILAAPLPEVGNTFESFARLRELKHRVVVVDLMRAVRVLARILPVPPHLVEQNRLIENRTSRTLPIR